MSDEFMTWTVEDKAAAFETIASALCTCSAAGPCSICDAILYGGDLAAPVIQRVKDADAAVQRAWAYAQRRAVEEQGKVVEVEKVEQP